MLIECCTEYRNYLRRSWVYCLSFQVFPICEYPTTNFTYNFQIRYNNILSLLYTLHTLRNIMCNILCHKRLQTGCFYHLSSIFSNSNSSSHTTRAANANIRVIIPCSTPIRIPFLTRVRGCTHCQSLLFFVSR